MERLRAALRRMPSGSAFSGRTAAWLHGLDYAPCDPIEANIPLETGIVARSRIAVRRCGLGAEEVVSVRGMPATSIVRTVAELCMRFSLVEGVVVADAALHTRRLELRDLWNWAGSHAGHRGIRNLRRVLELAEPAAESPMESRLRVLLIQGGLPRPKVQVPIYDRSGHFVGRPDLYYIDQRLGIEYDGMGHRDSMAADNRRQNSLLRAGVRLLRFTASDVMRKPDWVVWQVREMLARDRVSTLEPPIASGMR